MSELRHEAGRTSTRRGWLLPALSFASSALSYLAFDGYAYLHATLLTGPPPHEMVWLVDLAGGTSNLLAYGALALAIAAVVKGRRWQRVAGLVALLPALAVCAMNWMITF